MPTFRDKIQDEQDALQRQCDLRDRMNAAMVSLGGACVDEEGLQHFDPPLSGRWLVQELDPPPPKTKKLLLVLLLSLVARWLMQAAKRGKTPTSGTKAFEGAPYSPI